MRPARSAFVAVLLVSGCLNAPPPAPRPPAYTFAGSRVRSFTDSHAVQAIADGGHLIAIGTRSGVLRWDLRYGKYALVAGAPKAPKYSAVAIDAHNVIWAAGANDLVRIDGEKGEKIEHLPKAPVGPFVSALLAFDDDRLWAGGPEGLARLNKGIWEVMLADTAVTSLAIGSGGVLWVGTSGRGVLRIPKSGDRIDHFSTAQGCEVDVVRGMASGDFGAVVIGESQAGARLAYFDGERFHSYRIEMAQPPTWASRAKDVLVVGNAKSWWQVRLDTTGRAASSEVIRPAAISGTHADPVTVPFNTGTTGAAIDKATAAAPPSKGRAPSPVVELVPGSPALPDGVTAVASSTAGLLVGTRALGAARIENGVPRLFRAANLLRQATRLSVACTSAAGDDCYIATGGPRAYRFDGETFESAGIDPEEGSSILAVLRNQRGQVLALHRGAKDRLLRISMVSDGKWAPVAFQPIEVPSGLPDLNFARFSPSGKLWVGLKYLDKEGDERPFGAAEIDLESGKVAYHGQSHKGAVLPIPDDVFGIHFVKSDEMWLATRSGAVHVVGTEVTVYTENEGLATELLRAVAPGPSGEVWMASKSGTGRWDGKRWTFPRLGAFYPPSSTLAVDGRGEVFIGTEKGLYCVGSCPERPFDVARGLLDNAVLDVDNDLRGRAWVLTRTGLTIIDP